jgi:thiosulfate/3-mercaptopyruvate sulfurtransferase
MTDNLLVSPAWLKERIGTSGLKVVDASWYLPAQQRDPEAEFLTGHIPGAVRFDIDAIADRSSDLPHMLPTADVFAEAAGDLGISDTDTIVIYDSAGLFSAPRVWWTFNVFGAQDVRVLDGGLPAWKAAGLPLESGKARAQPARFTARFRDDMVRDFAQVSSSLASGGATVLDARSAERFRGEAPEPRPGLASGHMPGAKNLPYDRLIGPDGRLLASDAIRATFQDAGVDVSKPVVTACGSGVTAALLSFALARIGKDDAPVYDGSWAEWGSRRDAPIVTGPR